jgi:hypothetical protein
MRGCACTSGEDSAEQSIDDLIVKLRTIHPTGEFPVIRKVDAAYAFMREGDTSINGL